jgi:hypothetical protein
LTPKQASLTYFNGAHVFKIHLNASGIASLFVKPTIKLSIQKVPWKLFGSALDATIGSSVEGVSGSNQFSTP